MYVKSLIRGMKCTIENGIGPYVIRFQELQSYAPHVPSEALARMGRTPEALNEMDCREVLREALPEAYQNEIITQGWKIMERPWHATTDKLRTMEPMIQEKINLEKQIERLRVANNYSTDDDSTEAEYVDGKDNIDNDDAGTDFSNDDTDDNDAGTDFSADDDDSVGDEEDPRGTHNSPYRKCKWCSKWHKGICFKPWPEKNDGDDITMSKAQLYSMISSVVRKELKRN